MEQGNQWLLERSNLFARYAKGLLDVCDKVKIRLDKPDYGWINTHFMVNGEEKGHIELSSVYEPFVPLKEWLEDIIQASFMCLTEPQRKYGEKPIVKQGLW